VWWWWRCEHGTPIGLGRAAHFTSVRDVPTVDVTDLAAICYNGSEDESENARDIFLETPPIGNGRRPRLPARAMRMAMPGRLSSPVSAMCRRVAVVLMARADAPPPSPPGGHPSGDTSAADGATPTALDAASTLLHAMLMCLLRRGVSVSL